MDPYCLPEGMSKIHLISSSGCLYRNTCRKHLKAHKPVARGKSRQAHQWNIFGQAEAALRLRISGGESVIDEFNTQ